MGNLRNWTVANASIFIAYVKILIAVKENATILMRCPTIVGAIILIRNKQ